MKLASQRGILHDSRTMLGWGAALVIAAVGGAACMGSIGTDTNPSGNPQANGGSGAGGGSGSVASSGAGSGSPYGSSPDGGIVSSNPPPTGSGSGGASGSVTTPTGPLDPGTVGMHRLNAFEYDNTINDLFGLNQKVAETTFIPDEKGVNGFDSEADALTMSDAEFQQYFTTADAIAEQVFADTTLIQKVIPTGTTDLLSVLNNFGTRAYRRPLTSDEIAGFQALATTASMNGQTTFAAQVKWVVKGMLSSIPFLYRVELDPTPVTTPPMIHSVGPYELASRLSYLLWSSMPDATLFADAAAPAATNLTTTPVLTAEISRMLADPKAARFVSSFAGQWLGIRELGAHQVEPTAFKTWSEPLRQAMMLEMSQYFGEFLNGDYPWTQFLTAQVNFVNPTGPLAALYSTNSTTAAAAIGKGTPTGNGTNKVLNMDPNRVGFMGLGGWLTLSSFSYRTAPTIRGKWVLLNLLGEVVPSPPPGVPPLDSAAMPATDPATQQENVRARLLAHRQTGVACNSCHSRLDPIGLGMENFDGIGAYRTTYIAGGPVIDSSGQLPDGSMFTTVQQLAGILSSPGTAAMPGRLQELTNYAAQTLMTYALSRALNLDPSTPATGTDIPYLTQIQSNWASGGYLFKNLIQQVILNDTFRLRHAG